MDALRLDAKEDHILVEENNSRKACWVYSCYHTGTVEGARRTMCKCGVCNVRLCHPTRKRRTSNGAAPCWDIWCVRLWLTLLRGMDAPFLVFSLTHSTRHSAASVQDAVQLPLHLAFFAGSGDLAGAANESSDDHATESDI